ncbi:MAG: hypothetical protein ACTSUE_17835, partial [Promethearchaeota archaeon]
MWNAKPYKILYVMTSLTTSDSQSSYDTKHVLSMHTLLLSVKTQMKNEEYEQNDYNIQTSLIQRGELLKRITKTLEYLEDHFPSDVNGLMKASNFVQETPAIRQTFRWFQALQSVLYKHYSIHLEDFHVPQRISDFLFVITAYFNTLCYYNEWVTSKIVHQHTMFTLNHTLWSRYKTPTEFIYTNGRKEPVPYMNMSLEQIMKSLECVTWVIYGNIIPQHTRKRRKRVYNKSLKEWEDHGEVISAFLLKRDRLFVNELSILLKVITARIHMLCVFTHDKITLDDQEEYAKNTDTLTTFMDTLNLSRTHDDDDIRSEGDEYESEHNDAEDEQGDTLTRPTMESSTHSRSDKLSSYNPYDSDSSTDDPGVKLSGEEKTSAEIIMDKMHEKRVRVSNANNLEIKDYQEYLEAQEFVCTQEFVYDTNTILAYLDREIRATQRLMDPDRHTLTLIPRQELGIDTFMMSKFLREQMYRGNKSSLIDSYYKYV